MLSKDARTMASCMALVAGTAVGAGVLAMPAKTVRTGLLPSSVILALCWIYMTATALFILEVGLVVHRITKTKGHGLVGLAHFTLGVWGGRIAAVAFLMLHYSLLAAYISQGGQILTELISWTPALGPFVFSLALGLLVTFGKIAHVDVVNTVAVALLGVVFLCIIAVGAAQVDASNLARHDWSVAHRAIPVCFVALVFHPVVSIIAEKLDYDMKRIRMAVILGSFGPFAMFFAWNTVVIGITDPDSDGLDDPMAKLRDGGAGPATAAMASAFGLLAVTTSFIGFVFALMSFYTDMLPQRDQRDKLLYAAVIIPPTAAAMIDPALFEAAVDFAGTYGVTILFALFPAAMVWSIRYRSVACSWLPVWRAKESGYHIKQRQSSTDEEGACELLEQRTATTVDSSATSLDVLADFSAATRKPAAQRTSARKWPLRGKRHVHSKLATAHVDEFEEYEFDEEEEEAAAAREQAQVDSKDDDDDIEGVDFDLEEGTSMEELLEFETHPLDDVESDEHPDSAPLREADFSSIAFHASNGNGNGNGGGATGGGDNVQSGSRLQQQQQHQQQQLRAVKKAKPLQLVPGGKGVIAASAAIALGVMLQQMVEHSQP